MLVQFKNRNFYIVLAADIAMFVLSLQMAYCLRFAFDVGPAEQQRMLVLLPWLLAVKATVFMAMGVYRGMWRYTSLLDAVRLAKASLLATLVLMAGLTLANHFQGYSRSVFLADSIFTIFFCGAFRLGVRFALTNGNSSRGWFNGKRKKESQKRLLIVGAGDAAATIIRETHNRTATPYKPVACLDDDRQKQHRSLLDVPVRGPVERLPFFAKRYLADEILIAMPSVGGKRMREIVALCESVGLPFKTLPSIASIVDGQVHVSDVREVKVEDLLGRDPANLDWAGISEIIDGKVVAVTGAGGSIGSELCRQILRCKPAALVLIESCEYNLYEIEHDLRVNYKFDRLHLAMGHVQDTVFMRHVFETLRPQTVFHAAACKHVPMVEANPREGLVCNVFGSRMAMELAEEFGVERFVLVSTDKAVRPSSVMGASKRLAEIILQSRPSGKTRFMAVRFGNVLGSSGSVIPLFRKQIAAGGPVTVTHPDMTRYFMMLSEACQLILQAGMQGRGGEIFVLEMGDPIKIDAMARDMIRLAGKEPDHDIDIVYTGIRPGEKLFEELVTHGEDIAETAHALIKALKRTASDPLDPKTLEARLTELVAACETLDADQIKAALKAAVPEYKG